MNKTPEDVRAIVEELKVLYPDGICSLDYKKDYELLFSVRLAAQCTDERVNKVTPALFARFPTLEALTEHLRTLAQPGDLILTVGAGDVYRAGEKLLFS